MAEFDGNFVSDTIYNLLNVASITAEVADRIYHQRVPPNEVAAFPAVQYAIYKDFEAYRTLGKGTACYKGQYMVVGVYQDDPRAARDMAKLIQQAMMTATPVGFVDVYPVRQFKDEEDEDGDGVVYYRAGQIYDIEVEA